MDQFEGYTVEQLLAERRQNVQEMRGEKDKDARAMLAYHITEIDDELKRRGAGRI